MQKSQQQLLILISIISVGTLGITLPYPIFPPLFLNPENSSSLLLNHHYLPASVWLGITLAVYPLGQFLGLPFLGALSDSHGRKNVLMTSISLSIIGYLLSGVALQTHHLMLLIFSRLFTGFMEGNIAIARAIAVDLKDISKHLSFGLISGALSIGYIFGPLVGGILADHHISTWFTFATPFYIAAVLCAVTVLLVQRFIIETLITQPAHRSTWRQQLNIITRLRRLFKNTQLKHWLLISTVFTLGVDIFYQYSLAYLAVTWRLSPSNIAVVVAILAIGFGFSSSWICYQLARSYKQTHIILAGMLLFILFLISIMVNHSYYLMLLLFLLIGIGIAFATTFLSVQVSNNADDSIQGEVMGTFTGLRTLGEMFICLLGGILLMVSALLPLVVSLVTTLIAIILLLIWI